MRLARIVRTPAPSNIVKITTALALVILVVGPLLWLRLLQSERAIEVDALRQQEQLTEFQDLLGYGGLIHNFKNAVLRPDESRYRDEANEQAVAAVAVLAELDRGLERYPTELNAAYRTIRDYRIALDRVSALSATGATPKEIDDIVRIDDTAALESLGALNRAVTASINDKLDRRADQQLLLWLSGITGVVAVAGLGAIRHRVLRTEKAEAERHTSDMEAFTRIAAHDLKGPLNQIATLVEFIREDIDDTGRVPDLEMQLSRIDERVVRLNARVSAVFHYLQAGTSSEPTVPIDLDQLVTDVAATVIDETATLTIDEKLGTVMGRHTELETVIGNLLSNAVKHHPDRRPTITVWTEQDDHLVALHIADDGPGVPHDKRAQVFEMYRSLDQLIDPLSGVGLPMVRRIVNGWGGEVTIGDARPHGADVRVSLPVG